VPHEVAPELIVEWRALTVALLDRLREATRRHLGLATFAMSQLLQGSTWAPAAPWRWSGVRPTGCRRSP
jgi:uncharacterized protein DUF1688